MSDKQYNSENTGTLFRNQRKETERHPDHTGQAEVKCPHCGKTAQFWLAAWVKTTSSSARNAGAKFFSIAFTSKDEQANKQREQNFNDFDNDNVF